MRKTLIAVGITLGLVACTEIPPEPVTAITSVRDTVGLIDLATPVLVAPVIGVPADSRILVRVSANQWRGATAPLHHRTNCFGFEVILHRLHT
jgi:hypothetical protein